MSLSIPDSPRLYDARILSYANILENGAGSELRVGACTSRDGRPAVIDPSLTIATGAAALAVAQGVTLAVIVGRLLPGRTRQPPVQPIVRAAPMDGDGAPGGDRPPTVSVVVPARNEARRIGGCLTGLAVQDAAMVEVLIVDGRSTDGTREIVSAAAVTNPRIRLLDEPPLPNGMVGRPWAIAAGARAATGDWVLVVDADSAPRAGMVRAVVGAAEAGGYDSVSFAPRIFAPGAGARWLQASFVITLVYRFGAAGSDVARPERVIANGQCQLIRRATLERVGGYESVAGSFCDDVAIARRLATSGARVGFLDGSELIDVLMYPTARESWRAWPRSLNMRDATPAAWRALDAMVLVLGQALPVPLLMALAALCGGGVGGVGSRAFVALAAVNYLLLALRVLLLGATARSFAPRGTPFWLSPLADPATALRVAATMFTRPREWRGMREDARARDRR
jgi:dolichol-phosphate mannosyltransferase